MKEVTRPEAQQRKIHSKDEFELCYLRHQYFRKTTKNPDLEEMLPYMPIVRRQAYNTFSTYQNLFGSIGFEMEDLVSIGQVHLVSFLGLFSVELENERYYEFRKIFEKRNLKSPSHSDMMNKNKATFTLFLKQRMEDVVRICRQKARNVKAMVTDEYQIFYGPKKPHKDGLSELPKNYAQYGYKKLDMAAFRTIRKKSKQKNSIFKYDGNWYVCIPVRQKVLSLEDLDGANMNPRDCLHNMNPEEIFLQIEENQTFEAKRQAFEHSSKEERAKLLKAFIRKNRRNGVFTNELETAKKMLMNLERE